VDGASFWSGHVVAAVGGLAALQKELVNWPLIPGVQEAIQV
jgi:hypothetical protein